MASFQRIDCAGHSLLMPLTASLVCTLQLDAGIRGKAPGAETAAYIKALDSQLRVIGARCSSCDASSCELPVELWQTASRAIYDH